MTQATNTQSGDAPQTQGGCCCGTSSKVSADTDQRDTSAPVEQNVKTKSAENDQPRSCCGGK